MSIKLLNLHEHEINLSFITELDKNSKHKYEMKGWYPLEKNQEFMRKENDYIYFVCKTCGYKYSSAQKMRAYTTESIHNLFFEVPGTKDLYTIENKKVQMNKDKYYLADFCLINNTYKDVMYIGKENEIRDYLFSEMKKYEMFKDLYEKEKIKNKTLIDENEKKEKKINKLTKEKYPIFPNVNINDDNDDNSKGEYDIVLCVDSIKNLTNTGWKIKYNKAGGKQSYEKKRRKKP